MHQFFIIGIETRDYMISKIFEMMTFSNVRIVLSYSNNYFESWISSVSGFAKPFCKMLTIVRVELMNWTSVAIPCNLLSKIIPMNFVWYLIFVLKKSSCSKYSITTGDLWKDDVVRDVDIKVDSRFWPITSSMVNQNSQIVYVATTFQIYTCIK